MQPEEQNLNEDDFPNPQMPRSDIKQLYLSSNIVIGKTESSKHLNDNHESNKPKVPASAPPADIISAIIGDFGIWQLRTVLILFLCKIPAAWFMACIIFTAPELRPSINFKCDPASLNANQSVTLDQCHVLEMKIGENFTQKPCRNFVYDYEFYSLGMQYNLVCLRDIFVAWTQYWHLFGVLVGGVVATKAMRWISPRNLYFTSMVFQIILGVATGYASDLTMHSAFRFLAAVCCSAMMTTGQAIFMDILGGAYRWGVVMLYDTFWSLGVILLPGVSYYFKNWSHLYLGITFPTLILIFLLQWTPESPRWLLKNGKPSDIDRVEYTIRNAAKINDRTFKIPEDFRVELEVLREKLRKAPPPAAWSKLWHGHHRAAIHMIAAHLALAVYVVNFMGLLLNIRSFGRENRTISTVTVGFCEIIGCFTAVHLNVRHNKRKWQWAGCLNIFGGLVGCLGWTFTQNDSIDPASKLALWLLITAVPKITVACGQSLMLACVAELLPVEKKMTFLFSAVTWARIWLLTAPFINVLKKFDVALSLNFFAVLIIIGGICTCLLVPQRGNNVSTPKSPNITQTEPLMEKDPSPLHAAVWVFDEEAAKRDSKILTNN